MGLFFYTKIGSIRFIGDLPTTNIIEPFKKRWYDAFYHKLDWLFLLTIECLLGFFIDFTQEVLQILSLLGIFGQGNLVSILFFSEVIDDLEVIGLNLEIHFIDSGDLFSIIAGINRDEV